MNLPLGVAVNDDLQGFDLARALDEVSPERRAVALGYRFELDRRQSVAVYLLLKEQLRQRYGIAGNPRFAYGPNGKPYLADHPDIHFNLSHCSRAAACVVADYPVGIDVQEIAPVDAEVARFVLSEDEQVLLRDSDEPEVLFARYWTQKEACVKLRGVATDGEARCPSETVVNRLRGYVLTVARGVM